jgi:hypothetical protein
LKLYEIYTEILKEIGELDPSKAYKFTKSLDEVKPTDKGTLEGRQIYTFGVEGHTLEVAISYKPNGQMRVDFGLDRWLHVQNHEPILGDDYKSLYGIMNTVGTIILDSLRGTKDMGRVYGILAEPKRETDKANPKQRQLVYQLFLRKNMPGGEFTQMGKYYVLPENYKDYL